MSTTTEYGYWLDRETGDPTPGKWAVRQIDPRKHKAYVIAERPYPQHVCVAVVSCETVCMDELESNARLIAAAPELLAALDCLQELALSVIGNRDNGSDFDRAMDSLAREAEAAVEVICKAKGIANEVAREDDRC